jgi:transmembrane sensor
MEAKPDPARKRASREATEWSILLRDEPDDRDLRRRFDVWRQASSLNEAAWRRTERASDLAAQALPAYEAEWQSAGRPEASPRQGRHPRRWLAAGGALAAAACIALLVGPAVLLRLQADYRTETAELRRIELQDGSEVTLAPGSALTVAYAAGERRVVLLQGEAFFAVKPNPERPFRVAARSVQASVLGTSFDVRLEDRAVAVEVVEGTVRVDAASATATLQAGQSVRMNGAGGAARFDAPPERMAAWRQGRFYLQNRALGDAVDDLRRYFDGAIIIADRSLVDRPTTGVFNLADPEEALRGIAHAHGATVRRVTPWLLVLSGS